MSRTPVILTISLKRQLSDPEKRLFSQALSEANINLTSLTWEHDHMSVRLVGDQVLDDRKDFVLNLLDSIGDEVDAGQSLESEFEWDSTYKLWRRYLFLRSQKVSVSFFDSGNLHLAHATATDIEPLDIKWRSVLSAELHAEFLARSQKPVTRQQFYDDLYLVSVKVWDADTIVASYRSSPNYEWCEFELHYSCNTGLSEPSLIG